MIETLVLRWIRPHTFSRLSQLQRNPILLMKSSPISFCAAARQAVISFMLVFGFFCGPANAQTLELDGTRGIIDVSDYLSLYQSQEARGGDRRLRPVDEQKSVDAEIWQGLKILNQTTTPIEKVFVLRHPAVTGSGLLGTMGRIPEIQEVVVVDAARRLIGETSFVRANDQHFSLVLPPGEEVVLGMRLDSAPRNGMASIWSPSAFQKYNRSSLIMHNMLIGALLIMAVLLIGVRIYSGVSACLWAGLVALSTAFYFASYFGYIANNITLLGFLGVTLAHVYLILVVIFGLEYLLKVVNFGPAQGGQEKAVEATQYAAVFVLIIVLLGVPETGSVVRVFVLVGAVLSLFILPLQMRSGQAAARLILPGAAIIFIGCLAILGFSFSSNAAYLIPLEPLAYVIFTAGIALISFASFLLVEREVVEEAPVLAVAEGVPQQTMTVQETAPSPFQAHDQSYEIAMLAAREGVWDLNLNTDRLRLSGYVTELLGLGDEAVDIDFADWLERVDIGDRDAFRNALNESSVDHEGGGVNLQFDVIGADGHTVPLELRATNHHDETNGAVRCIGVIREAPASVAEAPADDYATGEPISDSLTGLLSLEDLLPSISASILSFKRHGPPPEGIARPVVLAIDVDRFKTFNEGLGTEVADQLLVTLSDRMSEVKSPDDILARVGGHQFALLTKLTGHATDVDPLVQELQTAISRSLELGEQTVFPTVSVGIAVCHDTDQSAESLLTEAQQALYEAQKAGQNGVVTYEPGMGVDRSQELTFETELRRALENYEMEIFYQPIMDLKDGRIAGFESLIRWNHPSQGLLSPAQFVPRAEELGLIKPLGRFALSMTSLQLSQWQQFFELEKPLFASVNISTKQLLDDDLVKDFSEIMRSVELAPDSLKLEVTESQLEGNEEETAELLSGLRRLGGGVVLDDFGTGHSSLERLRRFPFDTIKIDQSFVRELFENDQSKVMVKSAIDLAHNLDMDIVAEGVETEDVGRELLDMGCNYAQGYIFGAPMTAMEAQAFIANYWSK